MGVSGSGKTTIGRLLAEGLGAAFVDADDLHPDTNRAKMSAGVPLTDDDRWPWLESVGRVIRDETLAGGSIVACSALKRAYRDRIAAAADDDVSFIHLTGSTATISARMQERPGHFMPPALLTSQLETLEPLEPQERGATFANVGDPREVVSRIRDLL
ncbi:gluconokinase [Agromyces albus]|uniref:Gluconokinase n=2 Tax=Agromyces albus TaxID=205332 RepID=A0A4Q2L7S4_9MICO|nr:gluconokinase [Agromyces albus]